MAVVQNPLIGRARNSVGGTIFSTWKGKNVIRSKPLTVKNPKTDAQKAQRMALSLAVALYRQTASAIKPGFVQQAVGKSEYNAFVEVILRDAITKTPPTAAIVLEDLVFARGTMAPTAILTLTAADAQPSVKVTWSDTPLGVGQSLSDLAYIVAHNATTGEWAVASGAYDRSAEYDQVDLSTNINSGEVIHAYLFFTSADGKTSSDSTHKEVTSS